MVADVPGMYARFGIKVRPVGDGWVSVRCFAGTHRDRHPSARVHLRSGGFRCFTCHVRGGALDALQLLGVRDRGEAARIAGEYGILEPARPTRRRRERPGFAAVPRASRRQGSDDQRQKSDNGWAEPSGVGEQVDYDNLPTGPSVVRERNWTYTNAAGEPLGRVRRLDLADRTKRIWVERPDGDGWAAGLAGATLPLYQLPRVLEHGRAGGRVLLVEGEKACDALARVGLFATTNPGGAGKWRSEHTAALAGTTALAVMDCDLPGRAHAIAVTDQLLAAGVAVLDPLDPDPLRQDGYDVVDYLAAVADTVRAVRPGVADGELRTALRDHLERLLRHQLPADSEILQRRLERARHDADPSNGVPLGCERCSSERVHRVAYGIAFCPCGGHRAAP